MSNKCLQVWIPIVLRLLIGPPVSLCQDPPSEQRQLPTLTSAHQAHSLTLEQAARSYPVHISGVVTYYDRFIDPRHPTVWVSDLSGGIYVELASIPVSPFLAGDQLEITGVSAAGGYAPIIRAREVRATGRAALPLIPTKVTAAQMMSGAEDARWVEVEGIVQGVRQSGNNVDLDLALSDGSLMATTVKQAGVDYVDLVDSKLKIRGNQAPLFNQQGSMTGSYLLFPGPSAVEVEEPASPNPFGLPLSPIGSLLRFTPTLPSGHRVHVRGVVALAWPAQLVCIENGPRGLCAQTDQVTTLSPGQVADVIGFPKMGPVTPTLARATYQAMGMQQSLPPAAITISQAVDGNYDAKLVELDGELVGQDDAASEPNIVLISEHQVFSVVFPQEYRNRFPDWKLGSTFRIVGVCSVKNGIDRSFATGGGFSNPESFRILVRSLQDVVLIKRASWWTPYHAVGMLASAVVLTLFVSVWVLVLRKQVDEQTFVIRQQLLETKKLGLEIKALNNDLEKKIAERTGELKTANHELEAFSYSVSHDLRSPLRHIGGFSKILISDFSSEFPVEAKEHLRRIQDAVTRMGLLIDGLLSLAKLGQRSLKLHHTELNPIVERAIAILASECEGRVVEWQVSRLPTLECDQILVDLVFQNLIGNAVKYSRGRDHAVIQIDSVQLPNERPVIFVRDNGAGFDMRNADKLFGVFQRFHTQSEFEGTGVGLATTYRIVQKHGGRIWAEAEIDRGATFYFTLGSSESTRSRSDPTKAGA